jgi:hypothetical protein
MPDDPVTKVLETLQLGSHHRRNQDQQERQREAGKRRKRCGLEGLNTLVTLCGEGYEHSGERVGASISRTWKTKRALASVEILSSIVASLFLLAIRGLGTASNLCLDRP